LQLFSDFLVGGSTRARVTKPHGTARDRNRSCRAVMISDNRSGTGLLRSEDSAGNTPDRLFFACLRGCDWKHSRCRYFSL